jgi:AcrR family transcriptional regulator
MTQGHDMDDAPQPNRKADLRTRLIAAAEAEIAEKGLLGLKARDVTQRAGCALGAIYNAVADLDELVMRVNSRTLERLGAALAPASNAGSPEAVTLALADAYAVFALENRRLWSALFEHRLPEGVEMPDWHRLEHEVLIARIVQPLRQLRPDLPEDEIRLRAWRGASGPAGAARRGPRTAIAPGGCGPGRGAGRRRPLRASCPGAVSPFALRRGAQSV